MEAAPALVLSVASGVSYFLILSRPKSHLRAVWKTLPVLLLSLHVLLLGQAPLLVLALFLGALGDAFLAYEGEKPFVWGLVAFVLGHLCYAGLLVPRADFTLLVEDWWRLGMGLALVAVTLCALAYIWQRAGRFAVPIAFYVLLFFGVGTLSLAVSNPLAFAGMVLFILSDVILVVRKFTMPQDGVRQMLASNLVWATYYPAQLLLALSLSQD